MGSTIEFRNGDLPAIERGIARAVHVPVHTAGAVKIARMARAIADAAATLRSRRDCLVEEYAHRDAHGQIIYSREQHGQRMIRIDPERLDAFEAALQAVLDETIYLPGPPLRPADFRSRDGTPADLPAAVFLDLGPLFEIEEGDPPQPGGEGDRD